jgi:hypothetical protein
MKRTERIHRLLKDHRYVMAAYFANLCTAGIQRHEIRLSGIAIMVIGSEKNFSLHDSSGGWDDSQDSLAYDTLSATRLSHDA